MKAQRLMLALLLCVTACSGKPGSESKAVEENVTEKPPPATLDDFEAVTETGTPQMTVVLSEGKPSDGAAEASLPRPETTKLSAKATRALLSRMKPLKKEKSDEQTFAKRADSPRAPKKGERVKTPFPPDEERERPDAEVAAAKDKGLKILRHAPDGEVPIAPHVSVTFNQPMVPVTSHDDTVAKGVPVEVSPDVGGEWRWVGSKTVLFEPEGDRLPMATRFEATVPAGTESENGIPLAKPETWTFATPPIQMKQFWPSGGTHGLKQPVFISFDQSIDRRKLVEHIRVTAGGDDVAIELATPEEIDAEERVKTLVKNAKDDRWIVVVPSRQLPYDSTISVAVQKGAPSAEGPRLTESNQTFSFRTYGPLEVVRHRCGYRDRCNPNHAFSFELSNQIDHEIFEESMVDVEPSFPTMTISHSGRWLSVAGLKPGRRTYTVTLSEEIEDEFGQKLEGERTFEFQVGPARPMLSSLSGSFVVLDPSSDPKFTIFSTNYSAVRFRAYDVKPADWGKYQAWQRDWSHRGKHEKTPPGEEVVNRKVTIDGEPDALVETHLDLREALGGDDLGHVIIDVRPEATMAGAEMPRYEPRIRAWVQATKIGLDGFVDGSEFLAWATDLATGEPIQGVNVELAASGTTGETDQTGLARLELPEKRPDRESDYLLGEKGDDRSMLPEKPGWRARSGWYKRSDTDRLRWYVFDDRQMYRPGEDVHLKGWIRVVENTERGDVRLASKKAKIDWVVRGPMNNEIAKGESETTPLGGFDLTFDIPGTPNLGNARVELRARNAEGTGTTHYHSFQIQEFRTPEFEVTASAGEGPFFAGESAVATVSAKYYAGGALPNADTIWSVTTSPSSYTPPNQQDYTFGFWTPWWIRHQQPSGSRGKTQTFKGKTDATGEHFLKLDFGDIEPPRPMTVRTQASVMDVNRQMWTSTTNVLVHPSQYYVGLRTETYFVEKGEPLEVKFIVTDIDGEPQADRPVKLRAARVKYAWKNGQYTEELVDEQACEKMTQDGESTCEFETKVGGRYKITATTTDDYGRRNMTQVTRWVSGGKRPTSRNVEMEDVNLIPDRDEYQPGETAKILVQSPFTPAEGILTTRRNGIVEETRFTMSEPTKTLEVPIKNFHLPNVRVHVDVVGSAPRLGPDGEEDETLPRRPAIANGRLNLKVPPRERRLDVEIEPVDDRMAPGSKTSIDVTVKTADGKPAKNSEVALVVVDEAILSLSNYAMADPIELFYTTRPAGASDYHLRPSISLADPAALKSAQNRPGRRERAEDKTQRRMKRAKPAPPTEAVPSGGAEMDMAMSLNGNAKGGRGAGGLADQSGAPAPAIEVRSDFNPLAAFSPAVRTNADGEATVEVEMPDSLTRYRVMAVAVHGGKHFGTAEDNVTVRLPLMVRPSAPRFLNFGDEFQLPVVLQNQTDEAMTVKVATRASNIELLDANGYSLKVPANNRVEVRFPATTAMAGTARFQVAAAAGKWNDAAEFDLPVWTPATSEAFATYGTIDDGAVVQTVKAPTEVWPQFGGLEVTTSSTALQELTDAFIYLYDYDYECAEQISSRMVTVAALRDVLSAFEAEGMPSKDAIEKSMERDIEELASRQNPDGGFGFWRRGQRSWPFVSIHAAHALARAKQKGYDVPSHVFQRAKGHLQNIERYIPAWYSEWIRRVVIAYSLYVRDVMGDEDPAKARSLIKRAGGLKNLSFETIGWLLNVMSGDANSTSEIAEIRSYLNNRVTEESGTAHFAARTSDDDYVIMHSRRRGDGVVLEALIEDQPTSDLIPKIVRGLLAHRTKGRWGNTQENAFILLALDRYFNTFEKQTPDFVARIWLGEDYAGSHEFEGRQTKYQQVEIPMSWIVKKDGEQELFLQKDGKGRMYYRIGMKYAPKSLVLEPADHGFVVERAYEPVDDDDDVRREADGTWVIKAGAKVRVKLTMVAPTRRYHVALVDPLPAGLETLNPALATTGDIPQNEAHNTGRRGYGWWWWTRPWFEHQNMRDERTEAFSTLVWGGVHTYTYYARATTPGTFVVPPAKAEEMYHPETFGRSGTNRVKVVD